jgi:hypothetical protein
MNIFPLTYMGAGRFEAASPYHAKRLAEVYGQGEIVTVEEVQERSLKSHAHMFAELTEMWKSMPESITENFASIDHLRKWALIKAGYRTESHLTGFRTNAEAVATAAFIGKLDGFCICEVRDKTITVYQAESQSMRSMKKERFQQSKDDVLRVVGALIGADPSSISEAA